MSSGCPATRKHFSDLLLPLTAMASQEERITLSYLTNYLGNRSTCALLLFLALPVLPPVASAGISVLFGVPLAIISVQLIFERENVWLPRRLAQRSLSPGQLNNYVQQVMPVVRRLERLFKPRLAEMTCGLALRSVGLMCFVLRRSLCRTY